MERQPDAVLEQRFADLFQEICELRLQRDELMRVVRST